MVNYLRKGKSYEEIFGKAKSQNIRKLQSDKLKTKWQNLNKEEKEKLKDIYTKNLFLEKSRKNFFNMRKEQVFPIGENSYNYGKIRSEEFKKKLRDYHNQPEVIKIYVENNLGIKNPNWLGGLSFKPYSEDFNKRFKRLIKLRDNNCLICGNNMKLCVHHIDYNKLNSTKENCITLCIKCHMKTNFNRTHWIKFFHSLMVEKYNYCYVEVINETIIKD